MNKLGLDVGGVILDFVPYKGTDKGFDTENYLNTPAVKDAFDSIKSLNGSGPFKDNIYLVSKHGPDGPSRILSWLKHHKFFEYTGIPEDHFYPCRERYEKEGIVRKLGITHFVDDRAEVLSHMMAVVLNLFLFQSLDEKLDDFAEVRAVAKFAKSWKELLPPLQHLP